MHSSVTSWMAERNASTRRKVNGLDSIRRNRVCSSASEVNTDRGRLFTVESMCSFQCGKPSRRSSTLTRGSANSILATSWPVISHGVLPFQIRTRESGLASPISSICGGGANGQRPTRSIGYSGTADTASLGERVCHTYSLLDVDGQGGACGRGSAGLFGVLGSGLDDQ